MKPKFLFLREIIGRDKRKCERLFLPLHIYYALQPSRKNPLPKWNGPYTLDNISGSGLSFKVKDKIKEDANINIRIQYAPQEQPIVMIGRVVRCQQDNEEVRLRNSKKQHEYILGVEIYKTKKGDRRKFVNFISENILAKYTE